MRSFQFSSLEMRLLGLKKAAYYDSRAKMSAIISDTENYCAGCPFVIAYCALVFSGVADLGFCSH